MQAVRGLQNGREGAWIACRLKPCCVLGIETRDARLDAAASSPFLRQRPGPDGHSRPKPVSPVAAMGSPRLHNRLRAARLYVVLSWFLQRVQKTLKALPLKAPLPRRSRETVQARCGGKGGKRTGGPQSLPLPLPPPPAAAIALKPEAPIRQLAKYEAPSAGHAAVGATLFGVLLFLAGARPSLLPAVFLLFVAVALPWRAYHYTRVQPRNSPYLFDFCYGVAGTTAAFLVWPQARQHPQLEAVVYALADGPVAGALVAWQCAWVFHSPDHTIRCACVGEGWAGQLLDPGWCCCCCWYAPLGYDLHLQHVPCFSLSLFLLQCAPAPPPRLGHGCAPPLAWPRRASSSSSTARGAAMEQQPVALCSAAGLLPGLAGGVLLCGTGPG